MRVRAALPVLVAAIVCVSLPVPLPCASPQSPPFLWEADTTFGGIADKAQLNGYLDNLKAHGINGMWVQVEFYNQGMVNYKKTTLSGLPTLEKFQTGQWADDDFIGYVIREARARGMQVMIKFHGSNHKAWDDHPDWRKRNSKGEEVLWSGKLKNFCVNSPYWERIFFPMVKELAANYNLDGFYLDTAQVEYTTDDCCFCRYCQARFEKETGRKLPLVPVDRQNWTNPDVKLHAIKRVEWINRFYEQYYQTIRRAKPGAAVLLNVSGCYNSYKDTVSLRHAAKYVTQLTPEPVNTPRMYAAARNHRLKQAGQPPRDERALAREELVPGMDTYGYQEFMVKTMLGDDDGKPVMPISRYWFTDEAMGWMGPIELETAQIESAIGAGAKGYCFFGYLGTAFQKGPLASTTWQDPAYVAYLNDLASGPRAQWISDMRPDTRIAILYDRDADFWTGDYWKRLRSVGGVFSVLQFRWKMPVSLIATSEPDRPGFGKSGYRLEAKTLAKYDLVIAPGLNYVCEGDLRLLRRYAEGGGAVLLMGGIGGHGKFLGEPMTGQAYRILGMATVGEPTPSGVIQPARAMIFQDRTDLLVEFRISAEKDRALSYQVRLDRGWEVLAHEKTDSGKRPAIMWEHVGKGKLAYLNCDVAAAFTDGMLAKLFNLVSAMPSRPEQVSAIGFSARSSINVFRSADGLSRYIHIFTLDGESHAELRLHFEADTHPVTAEIIKGGGSAQALEMAVTPSGSAVLKLPDIRPCFAMIRVRCEKRLEPSKGKEWEDAENTRSQEPRPSRSGRT